VRQEPSVPSRNHLSRPGAAGAGQPEAPPSDQTHTEPVKSEGLVAVGASSWRSTGKAARSGYSVLGLGAVLMRCPAQLDRYKNVTTRPEGFMVRSLLCGSLALALLLQSGCSLFVGSRQSVTITPTDPAAEITVDGQTVGRGTVAVQLRRNQSHAIMAKIDNRVGTCNLNTEISTTGILDIVGGCFFLVPFLGLLGPGFWKIDPDNVIVYVPQPATSQVSSR
jgi:hypothetical protein